MMTFISMSVTAYATHLVGAAVAGLVIGAGVVYAITKVTQTKQLSVKREEQPAVEEKQLLVLENNC